MNEEKKEIKYYKIGAIVILTVVIPLLILNYHYSILGNSETAGHIGDVFAGFAALGAVIVTYLAFNS